MLPLREASVLSIRLADSGVKRSRASVTLVIEGEDGMNEGSCSEDRRGGSGGLSSQSRRGIYMNPEVCLSRPWIEWHH